MVVRRSDNMPNSAQESATLPAPADTPCAVILGANSAIAEATAQIWAMRGAELVLAGRNEEKLNALAEDLRARGATTHVHVADLAQSDAFATIGAFAKRHARIDIVLLAYGALGQPELAEVDPEAAEFILRTNFTSASSWCLAAANLFAKQGHGLLLAIGSVAGDRGRASNYVYGAAKGGLGILVEGIAHRLAKTGARAVLIKPGLVDTPMTRSAHKSRLLCASPEHVARIIDKAARSSLERRGRSIVYAPRIWRWIMHVIKAIPKPIFHRTKL